MFTPKGWKIPVLFGHSVRVGKLNGAMTDSADPLLDDYEEEVED
jgi:hypothetical protein